MTDVEHMVGRGVGSASGDGTRYWDCITSPTPGVWIELAPAQKYRRGLECQNMDDTATVWLMFGDTQPPDGPVTGSVELEAKSVNETTFSKQDRWWARADAPGVLVTVWEY